MSEPLSIVPRSADGDLIRTLRDLLSRAEAGEIVAMVVCGEATGRATFSCFAGDLDVARMIGALEVAKLRIANEMGMLP
jgi:hypothetical protein